MFDLIALDAASEATQEVSFSRTIRVAPGLWSLRTSLWVVDQPPTMNFSILYTYCIQVYSYTI